MRESSSSATGSLSIAEFSNPPIIEVVLSVAFEPISGLTVPNLVLAWDKKFKNLFPESEEQPPYRLPIETFGPERYSSGLRLEVGGMPLAPRFWFLDKEGTNLLQLQRDWFARNWRKQDEAGTYIRYATLREAFKGDFSSFVDFVNEEGLGQVAPTQCELTYIDHILPNEYWTMHGDIANVFEIVDFGRNEFLPESPEDLRLAMSYLIPGDEGPVGRLHMNVQPAIRKIDNEPIFVVNTTARGAPLGTDMEGVLRFLDIGHEWAVRGFLDVTTSNMHKAWGRKDA